MWCAYGAAVPGSGTVGAIVIGGVGTYPWAGCPGTNGPGGHRIAQGGAHRIAQGGDHSRRIVLGVVVLGA